MSGLCSSPVPPPDDEDLVQEVLLRLPPLPSSLPRASAVCQRWYKILSDKEFGAPVFFDKHHFRKHHRWFLYRFRKHHRKLPLIGFFDKEFGAPVFTPMLDPPNGILVSFALPKNLLDCTAWANLLLHVSFSFFGSRHDIALFLDRPRHEAVLWDPYTNFQRRVAYPPGFDNPQINVINNYFMQFLYCSGVCVALAPGLVQS